MFIRPLIVATAAVLATVVPASAAQAPTPLPKPIHPCLNDENIPHHPCVWDARHMGNGHGRSFIRQWSGRIVIITHADAHHFLRWSK